VPPRRRTLHHPWRAVQEALACFAPNVHLIRLPDAHLAADGGMEGTTAHHLTLRHGDVLPLCDRERERLAPSIRVLRTRSLASAAPALLGTDRAGERTHAPHRFWDYFGPAHPALRHTCTWTGTLERRFYRTSKTTAQRPRRCIRSLLPPSPLSHVARFLPSRSSPF